MVDQDAKKILEQSLQLTKENNEILRGIRNAQRRAQIYRFIYWAVIIAIGLGAYYFVQPYIESLLGYYGAISGIGGSDTVKEGMGSIPDLKRIQDLLIQLQS